MRDNAARRDTLMTTLLDDQSVVQRILDHIDKQTTDLSDQVWRAGGELPVA